MLKKRLWGASGQSGDVSQPNVRTTGRQDSAAEALLLMKSFEDTKTGWFWATDEQGNLSYITDSIAQLLGGSDDDILGARFAEVFVNADDDSSGRRSLSFVLTRQSAFERITLRAARAETLRYWSVSGLPQFDSSGRFSGYRGSAIDVTEHRQSSEHVSNLARYDALTRLPNRRRMTEALDSALLAVEHQKRPCAAVMIDLDRFKQVNDTLGHPAGDELLKQVAERLVRIVGDREKVFRLGGDEFTVILQNCDNRGIIGDLANDIIASLSQPYSVEGSRCIIGASIGVAIAPVDGASREELIRNADLALYSSKAGGRGRFRFFANELLEAADDKRALEEDLRDALAKGQLSVAYQPIVCATTNMMTGVEALVRWNHPTRGPISPALFIPIAEETALIAPIGDWLLRQACKDASGWPGKLRVAVNVSPIQFTNEDFPDLVESALEASGLHPDRLELEITEGVFLGESSQTDNMFSALKKLGVRLVLDDFGTGYSSLGYLRTAPFDKIKIDQSFVHAATLPGSRNSAIIAAIVALAEALDMETTAEGIEYMDQLQLVRSLRVSHVQGWIYSKAIPGGELCERIANGDWIIQPIGPARQRSARHSMFRKVGLIHSNRYDHVIVRNLSDSGALIDGIPGLEAGTLVVLDFGDGQLAFARVTRDTGRQLGVAFEQPLVDDGNGGLCTSHRVSPYLLRTVGLPSSDAPEADGGVGNAMPLDELAQKLGVTLADPSRSAGTGSAVRIVTQANGSGFPTFREIGERFLQTFEGDEHSLETAKRDLRNHVLPRFGQLSLDQISQSDMLNWLAAKVENEDHPAGTDTRLFNLMSQMWAMAVKQKLPGAEHNPLDGREFVSTRAGTHSALTTAETQRLLEAARGSQNRQLKFILALMMLTGARQGELLRATWEQLDLEAATWKLPRDVDGSEREIALTPAAVELLAELPRWPDCPYLLPNPVTRQPYRTIQRSWEVARINSELPYMELNDLRYCNVGDAIPESEILDAVRQGSCDDPDPGSDSGKIQPDQDSAWAA